MPFFSYKGRNDKGELVKGTLESQDRNAVAKQLLSLGITPVEIVPGSAPSASNSLPINPFEERIEPLDIMMFSRQMYTPCLIAGIPIMSALSGLLSSTKNKALIGQGDLPDSLKS